MQSKAVDMAGRAAVLFLLACIACGTTPVLAQSGSGSGSGSGDYYKNDFKVPIDQEPDDEYIAEYGGDHDDFNICDTYPQGENIMHFSSM